MQIRFQGKISEEDQLIITVDGTKKILDTTSPTIKFSVSKGMHSVSIESSTVQPDAKWLALLLYFLTILIQGVFHILFMNTDFRWYLNVHPINIKVRFECNITEDTEVMLAYTGSQFDSIKKSWRYPVLDYSLNVSENRVYLINQKDFSNQFAQFVKRIVSIAVVSLSIFFYLFYVSMINKIIVASVITFIVICGIVCWALFMIISQCQKKRQLEDCFIMQFKKENS